MIIVKNSRIFRTSIKIDSFNRLDCRILDYCSVVLRLHYAVHILRIERVQKWFLWHISYLAGKSRYLVFYDSRLQYYNMHSPSSRKEMCDAFFAFKMLRNEIDCPYLFSLLRFHAHLTYPRLPLYSRLRKTVLGANSIVL